MIIQIFSKCLLLVVRTLDDFIYLSTYLVYYHIKSRKLKENPFPKFNACFPTRGIISLFPYEETGFRKRHVFFNEIYGLN